ncbi:MAG TPA: DUF4412 domain-containing protein [Candidatus Kapabacteria bacterium]|jgi:hypothetical protein
MYKILAIFIVAVLVSSCAERGQVASPTAFEGTITEVIHVPGIGQLMHGLNSKSDSGSDESSATGSAMGALANIGLKIYTRENKVAYDVSMLGGLITMHSIIDRNARTLTVLLPNKTAMVMDLRTLDSARNVLDDSLLKHNDLFDSLTAALPVPTGKHETVEGLDAEEYQSQKGDMKTDLWLASDARLQAFDVVRDAFLGRGTEGSGGLDQVFGMMRPIAGKIPVKFQIAKSGSVLASGELTNISEEKLDSSIFEVPKDYTIMSGDSLRGMRHRHSDEDEEDTATEKPKRHFTAP